MAAGIPATQPDPRTVALYMARRRFPLLQTLPLQITSGEGPGYSETYFPWASENPVPGKLNIQLRKTRNQEGQDLQDTIASESLHMLGALKPDQTPVNVKWYGLKQQLLQALTPRDLQLAKARWHDEQQAGESYRPFSQFLQHTFLDGLIRGYLFPENQGQEWVDRMREGGWIPQQRMIIEQMRQLLQQAP